MSKNVLITGATSGIGRACANKFASEGHHVIICGRRNERLLELSRELVSLYGVRVLPLNFDVRQKFEIESSLSSLTGEWKQLDILINNAGLAAGLSTFQEGDFRDWEQMIDTNLKGLLYMSRHLIPRMMEQGYGHIINVGSIAGKETYPNGNVYCATKQAVDALSKAMRIDLLPHHIKVTHIAPGAAETEFSIVRFHGDTEKASQVYKGFDPLRAEDIAEVIYFTTTLPAHVNINDLVITPTAQANAVTIHRS